MHALASLASISSEMPKKPKNEAVTPDSEVKNADGDKVVRSVVTAETDSNAEVSLFA